MRSQSTLQLPPRSAPDPDLAVVEGDRESWIDREVPQTALLVVEVSVSTLRFDRNKKAAIYVKAGIADYWVVDVVNRRIEVRRNPHEDGENRYGWSYDPAIVYDPTHSIEPLARQGVAIAVADLLPKLTA